MIPVHVAAAKNIKNAVVNNKDSNVIFKKDNKKQKLIFRSFCFKVKIYSDYTFFS